MKFILTYTRHCERLLRSVAIQHKRFFLDCFDADAPRKDASILNCFKLAIIITFILLATLFSANSFAMPISADINPRKINIDQSFKGMELLVYGARSEAGNIVVVVRGPKEKQILRKKGKVFGIWTNVKNMEIENLYSMYSVSSMSNLTAVQNDKVLDSLEIGLDNIKIVKDGEISPKGSNIQQSVIGLMQAKNLYDSEENNIALWGETLFKTFIEFPKNITSGIYNVDICLFNSGILSNFQTMPIIVEKVGIEAYVHNSALKHPLIYGLVCVFSALILGLTVGLIFARKPN